ncbi:hypothetical protein [Allosalinactinospora lopnorensis]|uniref:hypothetical protein n=1 Tax=Allosalinactinospora lopnorensis TaxID=1352348 RepID=UPI00138F8894|nr:hypothetical protein [Allosalinactinospora lopnorensis]
MVGLELPLDSYRLDHEAESNYYRAEDLLVRECMEDAGFTWHVPDDVSPGADPKRRRYGVIDPGTAKEYGYHFPSDSRSQRTERLRDQTLRQPRAEEAYFGPESSEGKGCAARADRRLGRGVVPADYGLLADLDWRSLEDSEDHPDVMAAKRAWSTCMDARGYSYGTPREAVEDPAWNLDEPAVSEEERKVARADADCKYEAGMVETWVQVETEIQRGMIAENASELERLRQAGSACRENARAVLEELGHRSDPAREEAPVFGGNAVGESGVATPS